MKYSDWWKCYIIRIPK